MNKTKKNVAGKIAALVLMLTVISCCFLGSTFAKYTSSTTGTANVSVAKWQIDGVSENTQTQSFTFTMDKLSPAVNGTKNTLTTTTAYTITNSSDVAADITIALGTDSGAWGYEFFTTEDGLSNAKTSLGEITYVDSNGATQTLTDEIMKKVFTITLSVSDATATDGVYSLAVGSSMTITVTVDWNTQTPDGDAIDTAIGMYVKSITTSLTVTATQSTQVPEANP